MDELLLSRIILMKTRKWKKRGCKYRTLIPSPVDNVETTAFDETLKKYVILYVHKRYIKHNTIGGDFIALFAIKGNMTINDYFKYVLPAVYKMHKFEYMRMTDKFGYEWKGIEKDFIMSDKEKCTLLPEKYFLSVTNERLRNMQLDRWDIKYQDILRMMQQKERFQYLYETEKP